MELDFEKPIADVEAKIAELTKVGEQPDPKVQDQIDVLKTELAKAEKEIYANLTPWQAVQVARHPDRPVFGDYIKGMCSEFVELHGDRCFGDDRALIGGFAMIGSHRVMLIGIEKGRNTDEKVQCNFGMANPEGYRKALRLMRLAEKYGVPIVSIVDTPAAYPGKEAEERGQAEAIARNLTEMAMVQVPFIVVITGEGGSGGALGIAVGDLVLMLSNAIYSVIPPEGCAAILWRDAKMAPEAAEALQITAPALKKLKVIDDIIPEPAGGAHRHKDETILIVKEALIRRIRRMKRRNAKTLVEKRFDKYAAIGKYDSRRYASH